MNENTKFKKPEYLLEFPEVLRKYFDENNFKNKPYPITFEEANEYLLFEIFKVDKQKEICTTVTNEKGKEIKVKTAFSKRNFHEVFAYYHWSNIDVPAKITALYWFFEEIAKELNVYKPKLLFTCQSCYDYLLNTVKLTIDDKTFSKSAYSLLDTIAHELKHSQVDNCEQTEYFFKYPNLYISYPNTANYNLNDVYECFKYNYEYYLYKFQPIELIAWEYGEQKARKIFLENKKANKGKFDKTDSMYFYKLNKQRKNQNAEKNLFFGDEFLEHLDKRYLLLELKKEVDKHKKAIINITNLSLNKEEDAVIFSYIKDKDFNEILEKYKTASRDYNALEKEVSKDFERLYKAHLTKINNQELVPYE